MRANAAAIEALESRAAEAAKLLKLLANETRLLILCRLLIEREMTVGELAAAVRLGQSALSQHLAKMREEELLATRRDGQNIFYRIADRKVGHVLALLRNLYCR